MPVTAEPDPRPGEQRAAPRHLALVLNSQAGALIGQEGHGSLEDLLRRETGELTVIPPDSGTLPERIAQAQKTGSDVIVVAGGDGTVACAAQALAGSDAALGLIPCGTMNLLARDLKLDPADHEACARIVAEGAVRAIDVGELTGADGEKHIFLCASMLGTPARLSRHREAGRERGNGVRAWAGFGVAAFRALWRNRSMRFVLRYDGKVRQVRTPSLTIVVNALDDESGRMFGRSRLDGGTLAIYLVRRASVLGQLGLLLRMAVSGSLRTPRIEVIMTKSLEVESHHSAMHVLVDGEMRLLKPRLHYRVRPGALNVIAPA